MTMAAGVREAGGKGGRQTHVTRSWHQRGTEKLTVYRDAHISSLETLPQSQGSFPAGCFLLLLLRV